MILQLMFRPAGTAGQRPTRPHGRALHAHPGSSAALGASSPAEEI
ncbi:hypothetical protein [Phycobacter azelaicus]|nr:hypothetical protein [Phycobacter azelaicus]